MTEFFTWSTITGADVTDPKRAKYNDPIKKQKIHLLTNQQQKKKKHQTIPEEECESIEKAWLETRVAMDSNK